MLSEPASVWASRLGPVAELVVDDAPLGGARRLLDRAHLARRRSLRPFPDGGEGTGDGRRHGLAARVGVGGHWR